MPTSTVLHNNDLCARRAWYEARWRPSSLRPKEILIRSIEHGLIASGDAGEAAEVRAMDLCVDPGMDTEQSDLLGLASHIASLANFITWILREGDPWKRPDAKANWMSGAFLSANEMRLRRVFLVDRWDAWAQLSMERSWEVAGECSAYGVGMDCIIVEIGQMREGRWKNSFTTAHRHPVAKTLRFRRRDGEEFGSTWEKVSRESDQANREEWLDAMTDDGVMGELIHFHSVEPGRDLMPLAQSKLAKILGSDPPEENLTDCFARINPCPFRCACPRGEEPSEAMGFVRL